MSSESLASPFLSLPAEIRLMVYDCLTIRTQHHNFHLASSYPMQNGPLNTLQLVCSGMPGLSILRVCREIHHEAQPHLSRRLRQIANQPLRIIATTAALSDQNTRLLLTCLPNLESWRVLPWFRKIFDKQPSQLSAEVDLRTTHSWELHVEVAVLDQPTEQDRENKLKYVHDKVALQVQYVMDLIDLFDIQGIRPVLEKAERWLRILIRPAKCFPEEAEALAELTDLVSLERDADGNVPYPDYHDICFGDQIRTEEWDEFWEEGEVYLA
ncbi:hypothetical protein FB567DRAFT_606352 [Paraphoma chrysanthemicola]|uniref:F-box domain-containing protein n=1 Tax=Paraphoma chrysanthemicola TaxID=798071 RepID=A0A8K0R1X1_9PLEO|nr:hypothetical protein FB567DRAFT_606352 [Paraphoma chrysanthemicola]